MLVELRLVEQRYQAVLEVLEGATVVDVARRFGVARQTVHEWLARYAGHGLAGLADKSSKPLSCPHQMAPEIEARIVEMRREHPGWGPRTILYWLEREGFDGVPGRTSVERCLIRHGLVTPRPRKRRREDYRRWERSRSMELWQMDIVGGVRLVDGSEAKIVSGIDDHSRFVVSAKVVERATDRPVCDALEEAMARHGVPEQLLTGNGKVFTARFGPGPGPVLFDRICANNGIRHILTKPRSPTTTGKVERWHKDAAGRVSLGQGVRLDRVRPGRLGRLGRGVQLQATASGHREGGPLRTVQAGRGHPRPGRYRSARTTGHRGAGDDSAGQC